ncbi:glycoside hydrolase family 10 protein [Thermoleptolyngbya sp. C42_A2020_037]|uniref:glycoside hydrolase family 10 protein n=1 Tax=Thermoleptolyngbya sp. C42_A2020_037 TaxID=2747799 RepID=UPI0025E77B40|nr:glycoside hydrolase family 10 protein [Thermoleptolyngbya sp. C42_A2020_037]
MKFRQFYSAFRRETPFSAFLAGVFTAFQRHPFRPWRTRLIALGLALSMLLHLPLSGMAQSALPTTELRGVWLTNIDSDVLFSSDRLSNGLRRLSRLHFNSIYPTVWNWGYTLYPSATAERVIGRQVDPHSGLQQRDMLAEAVQQGHRLGLAVVPWFEFGFMAPADSELARRHPDWLTQRRDGSQVVMEGIWPRVWMNPFHPQVQEFILSLIAELAANYEIDGLQLDDHFGLPAELGYDPYTIRLYQQEHQGQSPPANPYDAEWTRWRADRISALMVRLFETVKSYRPDCLVALSPNTQDYAYRHYLQDWKTWERRGYVEELIIQIYRDNVTSFAAELSRPEIVEARSHIPVAIGILAGLKDRPARPEVIRQQVYAVRQQGFAGVSFFFYETLHGRDRTLRTLFPRPAQRPRVG